MILHDGNCVEFNINHVPAETNSKVWNVPVGARWEASPDHPVSGWRYVGIVHVGGKVVRADEFGEGPGIWEGALTAPQAACDPRQFTQAELSHVAHRQLFHGPSPDPACECGYRIVRNITELNGFMRDTRGGFSDYPVSDLPADVRAQVEHLGGTVHQSLVAVSVLGCGGVASTTSDWWYDPAGSVRVEWLATDGWVIANAGDPVVDALVDWGATVCVVPEVNDVHEPGECSKFRDELAAWELGSPVPVSVVLEPPVVPLHAEWDDARSRRFGAFGAAGVAVRRGGEVLLVHVDGRWMLPGGALREGESVGMGAVRETWEETGVDLAGAPVRFAFERSNSSGWSYTTVVVDDPGITPVPAGEVDRVGWFASPPVGTHPDLLETWDRIL